MNFLVLLGAFALGAAIALVARHLLGMPTARERKLEHELLQERARLAAHRESVAKHFEGTAQLFQDLTYQHGLLYRHLRDGARELCADQEGLLATSTARLLLEPELQRAQTNGAQTNGVAPATAQLEAGPAEAVAAVEPAPS